VALSKINVSFKQKNSINKGKSLDGNGESNKKSASRNYNRIT
jgi:hypothetical protein